MNWNYGFSLISQKNKSMKKSDFGTAPNRSKK